MNDLYDRLTDFRSRTGLSIRIMAKLGEVSRQSIIDVLFNNKMPGLKNAVKMYKICQYLNNDGLIIPSNKLPLNE